MNDWVTMILVVLVAIGFFAMGYRYKQAQHVKEVDYLRSNGDGLRDMLKASRIREQSSLDRIAELRNENETLIKASYQGRASDAKMRAFRNKAPKTLITSMSTWLDKAIARDEFKDWENKPTSMKTKDC